MTVAELIAQLAELPPDRLVTAVDPYLHVDCHVRVVLSQWVVTVESTGHVVTEEDVA